MPLKTILIVKTIYSSLILPNQPPYSSWTHKSCSFLWVICFSCLLRPEHFPPNSYGDYLLSFKNLFKYYFLKFPYSALFKMAACPPHHMLYSCYSALFSPHHLLLSNIQYYWPLYMFVIDIWPPQPIGMCQEAGMFVSFTSYYFLGKESAHFTFSVKGQIINI